MDANGLVLDDGTGTVRLDLGGEARSILSAIAPGDAIGAVGAVEPGTPPTILANDPAGLVRLGELGESMPLGPEGDSGEDPGGVAPVPASELGNGTTATDAAGAAAAATGSSLAPMTAGAGSVGALVTAGATLIAVRRRRDRRVTAARIARRIVELGTPSAPQSVASVDAVTPESGRRSPELGCQDAELGRPRADTALTVRDLA